MYYTELAEAFSEFQKSHDLELTNWRPRRADARAPVRVHEPAEAGEQKVSVPDQKPAD